MLRGPRQRRESRVLRSTGVATAGLVTPSDLSVALPLFGREHLEGVEMRAEVNETHAGTQVLNLTDEFFDRSPRRFPVGKQRMQPYFGIEQFARQRARCRKHRLGQRLEPHDLCVRNMQGLA